MSFLSLSFLFTKLDLQEIVIAMQNIENERENTVLVTTFCLPLTKPLKGNDLVTELALSTAPFCLFSWCKPMHLNERKAVNQADNLFSLPLTLSSHTSAQNHRFKNDGGRAFGSPDHRPHFRERNSKARPKEKRHDCGAKS